MSQSRSDAADELCTQDLLDRDLGFVLGAVFRAYAKSAAVVVDEIPGGPRGYQIVSAAATGSVESQRELARRLGVDRTVMTYLLDELETAGLVTRRPDPADRRNRHIIATDKGRCLLAATEQRLRRVEDHVLAPLSGQEQEALRGLLQRVAVRALRTDPMDDACAAISELTAEPAPAKRRRAAR